MKTVTARNIDPSKKYLVKTNKGVYKPRTVLVDKKNQARIDFGVFAVSVPADRQMVVVEDQKRSKVEA